MRIQRLLVDTHALLWASGDKERLSALARSVIADEGVTLYLSAATGWEIATKFRLGKLPKAALFMDDFSGSLRALGYIFLAVTSDHSLLAGTFPMNHKDPFDRLIAAQAKLENLPLLSADTAFDQFPIQRVW